MPCPGLDGPFAGGGHAQEKGTFSGAEEEPQAEQRWGGHRQLSGGLLRVRVSPLVTAQVAARGLTPTSLGPRLLQGSLRGEHFRVKPRGCLQTQPPHR